MLYARQQLIQMLIQLKSGNINNIGSNNVGARPIKVTFVNGRIETFECIKYLNDKYPLKKYNNILLTENYHKIHI
mgnify:CR=1 FL=1